MSELDTAKESIKRVNTFVYQNMLDSSRGRTILSKANEYHIPYDKCNIDFLELIELIEEYEHLLDEAAACDIEWDLSTYDVIGLTQEIEEHKHEENKSQRSLYHDLYSSRI